MDVIKFRSLQYHSLKLGPLPKGTDYADPIYYKSKKKTELIAYILRFSCSVTRAAHIELVSTLTTADLIKGLKRLILRRGKAKIVYSDNAKTFKAGTKWLANINKDQKLHEDHMEVQLH